MTTNNCTDLPQDDYCIFVYGEWMRRTEVGCLDAPCYIPSGSCVNFTYDGVDWLFVSREFFRGY